MRGKSAVLRSSVATFQKVKHERLEDELTAVEPVENRTERGECEREDCARDERALAIRRYATAMKISITGNAITAVNLIAHATKKMSATKTA